MTIVDCHVYRFRLPLVRPLLLKSESYVCRDGLVLKLTADNGAVGFGEVSPLPGFSKESLEFALSQTYKLASDLKGCVVPELSLFLSSGLSTLFDQKPIPASVRFGFEAAILNLMAASNDKGIAHLLSKTRRRSVSVNALLSGAPGDLLERAAILIDQGFEAFKLKVGRLSIDQEIKLVRRLREVIGGTALLRLDANRAWNCTEAELFWKGVASCGIEYVEEPVATLPLLMELASGCGIPIALDESLAELSPGCLPVNDNFKAVILKPTLLGLISSLRIAKEADEKGIQAVISSSFESDLGISILAQIAVGLNEHDIPAGLDTLDWFDGRLMKEPLVIEKGRLDILPRPISSNDLNHSMLEETATAGPARLHLTSTVQFEDEPAFITRGATVTYADYHRMIAASAAGLKAYGVMPGGKVGLLLNDCPQYPVLVMAIIEAGGITCPLNPKLPTLQLAQILRKIDCRTIITDDDSIDGNTYNNTRLIRPTDILGPTPDESTSGTNSICALDREATVVFTSGSSGDPAAVVHTLGNHYYSALGSARNIPFGPGDRWLLSLPLHHIGGLAILFRAIYSGGAVVVPDRDGEIVDIIVKFGVTHLSLVSTQLYRLMKEPSLAGIAKNLKVVLVGGSAVSDSLLREARERGLPVYTTYGLSEMASQVTTSPRMEQDREKKTSGRLLDYRQMKINDDGEILVKGETLFKGYLDGATVNLPVDDGGWFRTGDLGRIDSECNLILLGRKDNMFISGGENVYPERIESALVNFEDVERAIVVAVEDTEFGHRPAAFIEMRAGDESLSVDQWRKRVRSLLPGFMLPVVYLDWPESEVGATLKPSRRNLALLAAESVSRGAST